MPDLFSLRREYSMGALSFDDLDRNPVHQFQKWFEQICMSGMPDPTSMIFSSCGRDMRPSARILLLKEFSDEGFSFFSHYQSRKGSQIQENPYGSMLFAWHFLERQVRIEGKIEKQSEKKSDQYFENRPVTSRIGAWTSPQSQEIPSRAFLEEREKEFTRQFKPDAIPRPPGWGGYILRPDRFEFWQGRESRLHDRFEYRLEGGKWKIVRLAP
ncbi:MAG: pyridoxamine 5'-phosphate oxidase [Bacteroidales bacterium]|nr:pyridoxamine 5'-phosphate oxidase [Bacteroidales bacterium]